MNKQEKVIFDFLNKCNIAFNEMDKLNGMLIPRDMLLSEKKYDEIQDNIKELKKIVLGIIVITIFMAALAYCLNYMNPKPNVLEELEEKIKKVEQKEIILTDKEKELEQKSTEKEWEEVDKATDK